MIAYKRLSLADILTDCQNKFDNDKYKFFSLLDETTDLDEIAPASFVSHLHAAIGRPRRYLPCPLLKALLLQLIFSAPAASLLIIFLRYSQELRDLCGFDIPPDASKLTRSKQDFLLDLRSLFDRLVSLTEPICQKIDAEKAAMLLLDTSGIEAWVAENNPKYANSIIKQLKAFRKAKKPDDSYDPYKAAYVSMFSRATPNPAIRQMYINGHFCYIFKLGIVTNGLGIVRDITFYNKDFLKAHPEIPMEKKSDSPDEDKSLADSKTLVPVSKDFFLKHPLINPKIFLGDAAFDSVEIYKCLLLEALFEKACTPFSGRLSLPESGCPLNAGGISCCPKTPLPLMRREGSKAHLRCELLTMKFVCPKTKWEYNKQDKSKRRVYHREDPCTISFCGRMFYIYPERDFRAYLGTARGIEEWDSTYKIRVNVERSINHFKDSFCIAGRKIQDGKTLYTDLSFAGITQLTTVMVVDKINKHQ